MNSYRFDGAGLRQRRLAAGLTLDDLAAAVGRSTPAVVKWQSGATVPNMVALLRLSVALDCTPGDLFVPAEDRQEELVMVS